jgi:hypothetical protein
MVADRSYPYFRSTRIRSSPSPFDLRMILRLGPGDHCPCLGVQANAKPHLNLLALLDKILQLPQFVIGDYSDLIQRALQYGRRRRRH